MAQEKIGDCETCDATNVKITLRHHSIWFCDECWEKEQQMQKANYSPEAVKARVEATQLAAPAQQVLQDAKNIDSSIQVRTDIFNAATVAIIELKKAIDENPELTNKAYSLAETLLTKFRHNQERAFKIQEELVLVNTDQRAIQSYLNNMANQLRQEEREKLKIQDINYRPNPVKTPTVKTVKTLGTSKKAPTNKEIAAAAKELGIAEFTLKAFVLQNNNDLQAAVTKIKASIEAAKQVK